MVFHGKAHEDSDEILDAGSLPRERVDDGSLWLGSFGQVAEETDHSFHLVPIITVPLVGDPGHKFAEDDKIDNKACRKETVFANVVADEGMFTSHEDFTAVLIDSFLWVSSIGHVFDDNSVIRIFFWVSGIEEQRVIQNILDAFWLGGFLWLELFFRVQILPVVVSQMIVGNTGLRLDTSTGEEINERSFELCLAWLEVISDEESCERRFLESLNEGILGRSIDEDAVLM
jgi:hypothetical protein